MPALALALSPDARPVVGGSFLPTSIANLIGWHRADLGYSAAASATWLNQAPSPPLVLTGTASTAPSNVADAGYNSQKAIAMSAAGHWFGTAPGTLALSAVTVFVVGEPGSGAVNKMAWSADDGGAEMDLYVDAGGLANMFRGTGIAGPAWSGKAAVAAVFNGVTSSLYVSKKSSPATGSITAPTSISSQYVIGDFKSGAGGAPWYGTGTGKIAEVITYSRALSTLEIGALMDYAAARYSITVAA